MDAIRWTDGFVDALAGGRPVAPQDAADAELAALLGSWRDEMRWPPATGLIAESDAVAALNAGRSEKRSIPGRDRIAAFAEAPANPRKNRRGLSVVGAAAAAVLCIGGFGAVVAGAGPGDSLYGLRTMLFGASKQVREDQVGLAAKTELNQVQSLIEQGNWDQAQDKLVAVSTQVASVGDEQQKQQLLDQFNDLSAKVVERDPAATAAPGVIYTVPPSAAELVPAVAPSSTPTSTVPTSSSTSSAASSPATTSVTPTTTSAPAATTSLTPTTTSVPSTTSVSTPAPTTTSVAPAATSTPVATSTPAATTTPATAASTASQVETASQSAPTTTPTSGVPSTAAVTTPAAPEAQSAAPAAPTTTPAAPAAPASPLPPSPAEPAAPVQTPPPAAVTTTVVIPAPAA